MPEEKKARLRYKLMGHPETETDELTLIQARELAGRLQAHYSGLLEWSRLEEEQSPDAGTSSSEARATERASRERTATTARTQPGTPPSDSVNAGSGMSP